MEPELRALIRQLYSLRCSISSERRFEVIEALVSLGDEAAPELAATLQCSWTARLSGFPRLLSIPFLPADRDLELIQMLGRIGHPTAIQALAHVLRSGRRSLWLPAVQSLSDISDRACAEVLFQALRRELGHPSFDTYPAYCLAIRTVARLSERQDAEELAHHLPMLRLVGHDRLRNEVQTEVVKRLGALRNPAAALALLTHIDSEGVAKALVEIGPATIPTLLAALDSSRNLDSDRAIQALVGLGEETRPVLWTKLHSPETRVVLHSHTGKRLQGKWRELLGTRRSKPDAALCRSAIALCLLGETDEILIPLLVDALENNWSVALAVEGISRVTVSGINPGLRSALHRLSSIAHDATYNVKTRETSAHLVNRIFAATNDIKEIPRPSSPPVTSEANHPRAAEPPMPEARHLPRPHDNSNGS